MQATNLFSIQGDETYIDVLSAQREEIGFYDLCDQDITTIVDYAQQCECDDIIVIGIGGSALGSAAVNHFLKFTHNFERAIHIIDTTDPLYIADVMHKTQNKKRHFVLISKSGSTVETIAAYKFIANDVEMNQTNCTVITDEGSKMDKFAKTHEFETFYIPQNVGGRFSVLTAVGLVPLAMLGVDIEALLKGAKSLRDAFFSHQNIATHLLEKSRYYAQYSDCVAINTLFSYSEVFREFNAWYVQLWGESLGKKQLSGVKHVGLTPVGLIGPTDQHSFLQLIAEGKQDKSVTFIKIKNFNTTMKVPRYQLEHLEALDILDDLPFETLINMQADSIIESLQSIGGIAVDVIEIDEINEFALGELIVYYELLTALVAVQLGINAYDQPGVEMGKVILKEKLQRK